MNNKKRTYIIIGLCAILVVMAVGYAAFSQMLTINGTATSTNSWCLGFDNTKTNTYTTTTGVTGATAPTGSMSYSGTACSTKYVPTVTLASVFNQPGDQVEYTLTIKNASSVGAAIKSILIDNTSVTSNTTITKGNIQYIVEMPASTTLVANAETTMKVIAKFQNDTNISGPYSDETQTVQVKINAEQDDGSGGFTPTPTSYTWAIYRWSSTQLANKGSSAASTRPYNITNLAKGTDYITEADYPTATARATALNHNYYLKHDIVNDEIINSYVCFISDTEHCMKSSSDGSTYAANQQIIRDYQAQYNLNEVSTPSSSTPGCSFSSSYSRCYGGGFWRVYAHSDGGANVYGSSSSYCYLYSSGSSSCYGS